jgi:hypothetical protein
MCFDRFFFYFLMSDILMCAICLAQTVSKMAKKMLQALYYCHKHDVVHRDLKPESTLTLRTKFCESSLICGCFRLLLSDE